MKLTASKSFCYISDSVGCTVKVNIKEILLGNNGFLQTFVFGMDCSQKIKDLLFNKLSI